MEDSSRGLEMSETVEVQEGQGAGFEGQHHDAVQRFWVAGCTYDMVQELKEENNSSIAGCTN